jgi:hypothetical protein
MERTWKPLTGGILSIIGGAAAIGKGVMILLVRGVLGSADWSNWLGQWGNFMGPGMIGPGMMHLPGGGHLLSMLALGAGIALIIVGIIAVIGGAYAIKRRNWGLALAGSILSLAGVPPVGVFAIIFVALARKEFNHREELPAV